MNLLLLLRDNHATTLMLISSQLYYGILKMFALMSFVGTRSLAFDKGFYGMLMFYGSAQKVVGRLDHSKDSPGKPKLPKRCSVNPRAARTDVRHCIVPQTPEACAWEAEVHASQPLWCTFRFPCAAPHREPIGVGQQGCKIAGVREKRAVVDGR